MTSANVSMNPVMTAPKGSKRPTKETAGSGDFMSIMNASIKNNSAADISTSVGVEAPKKSDISVKRPDAKQPDTTAASLAEKSQPNDREPVTDSSSTGTKQIPEKERPEGALTDEELEAATEAMGELAAELTQVIADDLQIPTEEVTEAMDELSLTPADLSDPKNLYQLLGELTDKTGAELITEPAVVQVKEDMAPILDELVSKLPVDSVEELPGFAKELIGMIENQTAADIDLGPDGEVVSAPQLTDELAAASDEIIADPENENLTYVDMPEELEATPEVKRPDTAAERPYIRVEEDMDADQARAVRSYNDSADEMVTTARTMGSDNGTDTGKQSGDAFMGKGGSGFEHTAQVNVTESAPAPVAEAVSFAETVTETVTSYTSIDTRQIIEQIVTQVRTSVTESVSTMALELHPATLGKLYVQVSEQDGSINAKLFAENENVKQALETQMTALKEQWEQQGTKVSAVEISVATREFEEQMGSAADWNQDQNRGDRRSDETESGQSASSGNSIRSLNLGDGEGGIPEDMTEAERLSASMMRDRGNRMNIMA